jgi:hypothetical protein
LKRYLSSFNETSSNTIPPTTAITITKPLVVVEEIGSTVTLECSVKTDNSTTLTWKKDDSKDIPGVPSYSTDTSTLSSNLNKNFMNMYLNMA